MSNPYIPTNVRVEDFNPGSLVLDWDVSTVLEKDIKTRYNVWGSNNSGGTWDLIVENSVGSHTSITATWAWVAVSSIHSTLGESDKSAPLVLQSPETLSGGVPQMAVGLDEDGNHHFLKVSSDGGLILGEGISISIDTTDLSTEAKQDELMLNVAKESKQDVLIEAVNTANTDIVAAIGTNNTEIVDAITDASSIAAKEAKQDITNTMLTTIDGNLTAGVATLDHSIILTQSQIRNQLIAGEATNAAALAGVNAIITAFKASNESNIDTLIADLNTFAAANGVDLTDMQTQLDTILAEIVAVNANIIDYGRVLLREEYVIVGADPGGVKFTVPWEAKSIINQVTVIQEAGSATDFTVEVFNKAISNSARNVILKSKLSDGFSPTRLDFLHTLSYINLDGADTITIKVTPNNGTSNNFFVSINGEKTH